MSSNDLTLETIALSFSGGSGQLSFLIGRIWEIIQGYVFNKTWKADEELAGLFPVSFLYYFLSTSVPCCNTGVISLFSSHFFTHHLPKNTIFVYLVAWIGKIRNACFQKQPCFYVSDNNGTKNGPV